MTILELEYCNNWILHEKYIDHFHKWRPIVTLLNTFWLHFGLVYVFFKNLPVETRQQKLFGIN